MRTSRNYYEILGVPRNATFAQIKRRYKQLVRKYHPDVADTDKATAHRLFIQIREAYEVLSDPSRRRAYDATLDKQTAPIGSQRSPGTSQSSNTSSAYKSPSSRVAQHIRDAQWAFIQRRFQEAINQCKAAIELDSRNAKAYAILGDIYRIQGKPNSAVKYYSYALQYDPTDRESEKKLMNLMGTRVNSEPRQFKSGSHSPATVMTINMVWWGIAFFLIMLIGVHPGKPIPWLAYYIPHISQWSWNLVGLMAASSAVMGMLLAINRLVGHPDDELILENTGGNWTLIPTGLILLIGSGFFFLGAAAFYLIVGLMQGSLSRSVVTVFAAVLVVVLLSALMYEPGGRLQVLMFGGNISFLSMLFGWYIGWIFRPLSEY